MIVHCLFEQSATFKNVLNKFGYKAYDYDIDNQFGETDYQVDLFQEIEQCYRGESSIFDNIKVDDLIIAFFPCIRFTDSVLLHFRCNCNTMQNWDDIKKLEYSKKLSVEQSEFYNRWCELFIIALQRNLRLIVENPYNAQSYLNTNFCIKPSVVDLDRTNMGDKFRKPTQYWFININPKNNKLSSKKFIFGQRDVNRVRDVRNLNRSLISSEYAENFIRRYII